MATIIAGELFPYVQQWLVMLQLQYELKTITISYSDNRLNSTQNLLRPTHLHLKNTNHISTHV